MDSIAARRWRSAAASLRNPCCGWSSAMGQTVRGALESRILPQGSQDIQTIAGANAILLQIRGGLAGYSVADEKVPGEGVA